MTLAEALQAVPPRLNTISDEVASHKKADGHWSKKEILGHLIDSACNNHQRFVRAQFAPALELPTYEQERWVSAQAYASRPWQELISLWLQLNRHLLHVIRHIPEEAMPHTISIGGRPPVTLAAVIADYVAHMEHHLSQILD